MKIVKKIGKYLGYALLGIIVLLCLALVISVFLPSEWEIQKAVQIKASPEFAFDKVNNIKNWSTWMGWNTIFDPTLSYAYTDITEGVDASMQWSGEQLGTGTLIFDNVVEDELIEYTMVYDKQKAITRGYLQLVPGDDFTTIIWADAGDVGFDPIARYLLLFNKNRVHAPYDFGLIKLKMLIEGNPNVKAEQ